MGPRATAVEPLLATGCVILSAAKDLPSGSDGLFSKIPRFARNDRNLQPVADVRRVKCQRPLRKQGRLLAILPATHRDINPSAESTAVDSPHAKAIDAWHRVFQSRDLKALDTLLADDATFHSPIVHSPQVGKALTKMYLTGAFFVLGNESFRYVREVIGARDAVLEFVAEVDGITINGVDMIRWNDQDRIVDFKVMIRPLKAINLVHQKMAAALGQFAKR